MLVFSFIQKNFPEFFPSSFTEQRQNAMKIYRDIAPLGPWQLKLVDKLGVAVNFLLISMVCSRDGNPTLVSQKVFPNSRAAVGESLQGAREEWEPWIIKRLVMQ